MEYTFKAKKKVYLIIRNTVFPKIKPHPEIVYHHEIRCYDNCGYARADATIAD